MSSGDDNIFTRWSRRKQTVQDSERLAPEPAPEVQAGEDQPEGTGETMPAEEPGIGSELEAPVAATPLPRLEDLTAESDLSAFLQEGVPENVRRAALRRSWSLDAAIRDYVGPSENAWDFNTPGSIPGFGPLSALDAAKAAADILAKMSSGGNVHPTEAAALSENSSASPEVAPGSLDTAAEAGSAEGQPAAGLPEASRPVPVPEPASAGPVPACSEPEGENQGGPATMRPRHGSAFPR